MGMDYRSASDDVEASVNILFPRCLIRAPRVVLQFSDGYNIEFSGTDAKGIFKSLTGDVVFNENELETSQFHFSIDVNSINTGNGMKNKHAVSDKWFDAKNYPTIDFKSSKFSKIDNGYQVTGVMEIHGIKKEMNIPFTFDNNIFKAAFSVNRLDFNVGTMKGMMKKVSNEIKLNISIPIKEK